MYRIVTRAEAGLPTNVTSSGGSPRPPLSNCTFYTAHYTGNNIDYTGQDAAAVTRQIQQVFASTKPFEYNYVIGQNEDDQIIEYAGTYQAAHSSGENHNAVGVLFLLGVGENPTPTMINKWRWLREELIVRNILQAFPDQRMHKDMPDAATACPGNIQNYWPEFLKNYVPPVTNQKVFDMYTIDVTRSGWPGPVRITVTATNCLWNANGFTVQVDQKAGVPHGGTVDKTTFLGLLVDRPGKGKSPFVATFQNGAYRDDDIQARWNV